tara:strand:+ start:3660 stop:6299 length:2640 start_codon:yes stop_codon:yes gene_type:complete
MPHHFELISKTMSSVQTTVHKGHLKLQPNAFSGEPKDAQALVKSLVGSGVIQEKTAQSVEFWQGNSMPDTGLAFNISGRATVIEANVGEALAGFDDPIKAVFNTQVCKDKSVIVKRKYVVGGKAVLTPERSAARSVSVKEDAVKVELSRYGGDVSMNTNLFLAAELAKEELDMKVNAQKRELERRLVELGYAELMSRALRLPTAFVRSTIRGSALNQKMRNRIQERRAKAVYANACFGAFGKYEFPLSNLLAAAKTATAYTGTTGPGDVMIVPHGSPEMLKHTKQSSIEYKINGLKTTDHTPISMTMDNVFDDPSSGIKIAIHRPLASYTHGSAFPEAGRNCLEEVVSVWLYYPMGKENSQIRVTNFEEGGYIIQKNDANGGADHHEHEASSFDHNRMDGDNRDNFIEAVTTGASMEIANVGKAKSFQELIQKIDADYNGTSYDNAKNVYENAYKKLVNIAKKEATSGISESSEAADFHARAAKVYDAFDSSQRYSNFLKTVELLRMANTNEAVLLYIWMTELPLPAGITAKEPDIMKLLTSPTSKAKQMWKVDIEAGNLRVQNPGAIFKASSEKDAESFVKKLNNKKTIVTKKTGGSIKAKDTAGTYFSENIGSGRTGAKPTHYVRRVRFSMLNAVIAKAGSETGSLLVGYPMTSVSTNARTEAMTVALRVYLGAILKRPENALVLPHVAFGGVVSDTGLMPAKMYQQTTTKEDVSTINAAEVAAQKDNFDAGNANDYMKKSAARFFAENKKLKDTDSSSTFSEVSEGGKPVDDGKRYFQIQPQLGGGYTGTDGNLSGKKWETYSSINKELMTEDLLLSAGGYAVGNRQGNEPKTMKWQDWIQNTGCLGHLDHPEYFEVVNGLQVYKPPVKVVRTSSK